MRPNCHPVRSPGQRAPLPRLLIGLVIAGAAPGLLLTLGSASAQASPRSVSQIERDLKTVEGQIAYYLSTIKAPTRQRAARYLRKRLIDGMILYRMKDYSRAAIALMDVIQRAPSSTPANEAAFFLGDSMFKQREFMLARTYFMRVVGQGSSSRYYQMALQRLLELEMRRATVFGRSKTPDPERMRQVEDLIRKIESIPAEKLEPSVDYVRGKYLYFQGKADEALKIFATLGPKHPYHLQAIYFIGVCHIAAGRLNAAAAVYQKLIDRVLFGYFKPTTAIHRRMLQLIIMAGARLAYYRGGEKDVEKAIELYNAVPRKSPYFDDALYERAWAYLKIKQNDRAMKALELLQVANPDYGRTDEAQVLLGNLKMQTGDFAGAKGLFRKAAATLRPIYRRLRGFRGSEVDSKAIFAQLMADNIEQFDVAVRLPPLALRWLRRQPQVKRALITIEDLKAIRRMVRQSETLVRQIQRRLRSGSLVASYPSLALSRSRAADLETQLLQLRGDLAAHLRKVVASDATAKEREALDSIRKRRLDLEARLKQLPRSTDAYKARVEKIRALFDAVDSDALVVQMQIKNLEAAINAVESYYHQTRRSQRLSPKLMARNLKALRENIRTLKDMIRGLREDIADSRTNVAIGDPVMQYEQKLRSQLRTALQREQQLANSIAARMSPERRARKATLDRLMVRSGKAQRDIDRVNKRIKAVVGSKRDEIHEALQEEKAKISGYRQQLAAYYDESGKVVGGVAVSNFRRVSGMVKNVLIKADVGVLDVVWAIKNLAKSRSEKRETQWMRAMEALKNKYREPRGMP